MAILNRSSRILNSESDCLFNKSLEKYDNHFRAHFSAEFFAKIWWICQHESVFMFYLSFLVSHFDSQLLLMHISLSISQPIMFKSNFFAIFNKCPSPAKGSKQIVYFFERYWICEDICGFNHIESRRKSIDRILVSYQRPCWVYLATYFKNMQF